MIEELIERNISPTETAQALLNFLTSELPAGGHPAELRFLRFFPSLCDCAFGKIKEDYRFNSGGWMTLSNKPGTSVLASSLGGSSSTGGSFHAPHRAPAPVDPIVVLLTQELIPAITSEQLPHAEYKFPFLALPEATQQAWLAFIEQSLGGKPSVYLSENQTALFQSSNQKALMQYRRKKLQLSDASPRAGRSAAPAFAAAPPTRTRLTSPTMSTKTTLSSPAKTGGTEVTSPDIMLNTIQYYSFQLLLLPLAEPVVNNSVPGFRGRQPPMVKKESYGESLYYQAFGSTLRYFLPYDKEHTVVSEFLRILITLWLETQKIDPTAALTRRISKRWDLDDSWDLVRATYDPPCAKVQRCLRTVIVRLVADPALPRGLDRSWCLSPSATAMQQSFYNTIRATFRHASIHVSTSPFHSVVDLWLVWLEPWNVIDKQTATKREFPHGMRSPNKQTVVQHELYRP